MATKKSCLCGVSLFVRDRCRYVGKDASLRKYYVNSRNRQSKRNLLNFIRPNEGISTLEYKTYHKGTIFELSELKSLSFYELDFIDLLLQLVFFS
jgi:hypothetical protein